MMPLGTEIGLGTGDFVRRGPSYPQKKWHTHPTQFFAHVYCGQTAGWMKTPLGTEVDLSPCHIVLDNAIAPAKGSQQAPFSAHVCCDHGHPSQLLLSSCSVFVVFFFNNVVGFVFLNITISVSVTNSALKYIGLIFHGIDRRQHPPQTMLTLSKHMLSVVSVSRQRWSVCRGFTQFSRSVYRPTIHTYIHTY